MNRRSGDKRMTEAEVSVWEFSNAMVGPLLFAALSIFSMVLWAVAITPGDVNQLPGTIVPLLGALGAFYA